jgi:hypothetical protein
MEMILREKGLLCITTGNEIFPIDRNRDSNYFSIKEKLYVESLLYKESMDYITFILNLGDLSTRKIKDVFHYP